MATEPMRGVVDTVPASRQRSGASRLSARHSLRMRLPLLISAFLVAAVAMFLWAANREVEATLVRAGGERARNAASQVAGLLERSSQPGLENLRQAAALLRHCKVFLSVDTSLMHLAAAAKVPRQIVIETPTWNKPIEPRSNA